MPNWVGPWDLLILLLVVLLIFGPKRLPEMGRSLGRSMREFKDSVSGRDRQEDEQPELPRPAEPTGPAAAAGTVGTAPTSREQDTI